MATDPATEAAARALHSGVTQSLLDDCPMCQNAKAVVAAVAPLIRRQAFNEAEQAVRGVVGDCSGPEAFEVAILAVRGLSEAP